MGLDVGLQYYSTHCANQIFQLLAHINAVRLAPNELGYIRAIQEYGFYCLMPAFNYRKPVAGVQYLRCNFESRHKVMFQLLFRMKLTVVQMHISENFFYVGFKKKET